MEKRDLEKTIFSSLLDLTYHSIGDRRRIHSIGDRRRIHSIGDRRRIPLKPRSDTAGLYNAGLALDKIRGEKIIKNFEIFDALSNNIRVDFNHEFETPMLHSQRHGNYRFLQGIDIEFEMDRRGVRTEIVTDL